MLFEVRREEVGAGAFSHLGSRADHNVPDLNYENTKHPTENYIHKPQGLLVGVAVSLIHIG